jgi:predicted CopG family antitoxin
MVKQIRVSDEAYTSIVRLKGFLELKRGEDMSIGDMINELLDHYPKQSLGLAEDDIFEVSDVKAPDAQN